jgi:CubicO group peptidase (beta-lactamase class C family)
MMRLKLFAAGLVTLISVVVTAQKQAPAFIQDSLDSYIRQGMKDWDIPGMAIAIVKDGKVIVSKGYGVRDIETKQPVDENTLFMIASNSKLFTSTALTLLEERNKLSLNDKVTKYIKGFELYDRAATEMVTLRDLLSHRIGTKTYQGDFTFWNSNISRRGIMARMRYLKPSLTFRQDFGYCNSCYLTAGEVIPAVTRQPWEVFVYDSLLLPVQMTNTHMLTNGIDQRPNASKPYTTRYTGSITELPYDNIDNLGGAAAMVSNVKDMAKWLMFQLDSGKVNGKQIMPWEVLQKTRDVNTMYISRKTETPPSHFRGYAMGVYMSDYNGRQLYHHLGRTFGFLSNNSFVPEENLGVVIFTNNDNQRFFEALRMQVLDAYLGVPYTNRSKALLGKYHNDQQKQQQLLKSYTARLQPDSFPVNTDSYTGTFFNEVYGFIIISKDEKQKQFNIEFKSHNNLKATLQYMNNDEWLLTYGHKGYGYFPVKFKSEKGKIIALDVRVPEFIDMDNYLFIKK